MNLRRQVVSKFGEADLSTINSKAGFFMGIIKRFREQARNPFVLRQLFCWTFPNP